MSMKKGNKGKKSNKEITLKKANKINKANNANKDDNYELDLTDRSFLDFKKSKSISITTKLSSIKESKIGELYDTKILYDGINKLCVKKVSNKGLSLTKKASKDICDCLFDKNKNLSVNELEKNVLSKIETPGSQCVKVLDKFLLKNKVKSKSSKSKSSKSKSSKSKSSKR